MTLLRCSKGTCHCWCDTWSLLLPMGDSLAFGQNVGLCWDKYYIFMDNNTGLVQINETVIISTEYLFNEVHQPHSAKWKSFINLCLNILRHILWTRDNSRLNTKPGESPDIFENSWLGNCPILLLIKKDLSPLGIGRGCLSASSSNSASTAEITQWLQASNFILSVWVLFFFFCTKNRLTDTRLYISGRNKELLTTQ